MDRAAAAVLLLVAGCGGSMPTPPAQQYAFALPPTLYATTGVPFAIYFNNVARDLSHQLTAFAVSCDIGSSDPTSWSVTPTDAEAGDHDLALTARAPDGETLTAKSTVHVAPAKSTSTSTLSLILVGDSLTQFDEYPPDVAKLLSGPSNPPFEMEGTIATATIAGHVVRHEGHSGWSWQRYATHVASGPNDPLGPTSPFLDATGKLDIPGYLAKVSPSAPPTVVTFELGINDCIGVKPSTDDAAIDTCTTKMFGYADPIIRAFQEAAVQALGNTSIGIAITTPGNVNEAAFTANYHGEITAADWTSIERRMVVNEVAHWGGMQSQGIFLVPTNVNLDCVNGFPANNGVHPNAMGFQQVADSFYGFLKFIVQ